MSGGVSAACAATTATRPTSALRLIAAKPEARRRRRAPGGEPVEQPDGVVVDEEGVGMVGMDESCFHAVRQEAPEAGPVPVHVERADGLHVYAELRPGEHLQELLERAQAAGQREEAVGQLR